MSSKAIPAHLRNPANGEGDEAGAAEFARKHHGKTQSHVVSCQFFVPRFVPRLAFQAPLVMSTRSFSAAKVVEVLLQQSNCEEISSLVALTGSLR